MKTKIVLVGPDEGAHDLLLTDGGAGDSRFSVQSYFDGASALAGLRTETPDVAMLELDLPEPAGVRCLRSLRIHHPTLPVVATSRGTDDGLVLQAFLAGATGLLVKPSPRPEIVAALLEACDGGSPMNPPARKLLTKALARMNDYGAAEAALSMAETEVFLLLLQRERSKSIAGALGSAVGTVEVHTGRIFQKFGVHSRHALLEQVLNPANSEFSITKGVLPKQKGLGTETPSRAEGVPTRGPPPSEAGKASRKAWIQSQPRRVKNSK